MDLITFHHGRGTDDLFRDPVAVSGYPFTRAELVHVVKEMCGGGGRIRTEKVPMQTDQLAHGGCAKFMLRAVLSTARTNTPPMRFLLALALLLPATLLSAQDVLDKISRSTCDCLLELDRNQYKGEALQMQLGLCMMKASAPFEKELRKQYKVDLSRLDAGAGEKLGELVGMRLVSVCPEFLQLIADMESDALPPAVELVTATVTGVVAGLRDRQFSTVLVKDISGRTVELLRLEHFQNADLLVGAGATSVKGTFKYTVRELYDPVAGTYRAHNVLVGLELE